MPSYSPVFSQQFIVFTDATPNTTFEVPSGYTAVVRDFTVYGQFAATDYQLTLADSEAAPNCVFAQIQIVAVGGYEQWTGRVVVPEGGIITLFMGELEIGSQVYVGGYLLRNTLS